MRWSECLGGYTLFCRQTGQEGHPVFCRQLVWRMGSNWRLCFGVSPLSWSSFSLLLYRRTMPKKITVSGPRGGFHKVNHLFCCVCAIVVLTKIQLLVIDGKGHIMGRLASTIAKQLLEGQKIVCFLFTAHNTLIGLIYLLCFCRWLYELRKSSSAVHVSCLYLCIYFTNRYLFSLSHSQPKQVYL